MFHISSNIFKDISRIDMYPVSENQVIVPELVRDQFINSGRKDVDEFCLVYRHATTKLMKTLGHHYDDLCPMLKFEIEAEFFNRFEYYQDRLREPERYFWTNPPENQYQLLVDEFYNPVPIRKDPPNPVSQRVTHYIRRKVQKVYYGKRIRKALPEVQYINRVKFGPKYVTHTDFEKKTVYVKSDKKQVLKVVIRVPNSVETWLLETFAGKEEAQSMLQFATPEEWTMISAQSLGALVLTATAIYLVKNNQKTAATIVFITAVTQLFTVYRSFKHRADFWQDFEMSKIPEMVSHLFPVLDMFSRHPNAIGPGEVTKVLPYAKLAVFFLTAATGLATAPKTPSRSAVDTLAYQLRNAKIVSDSTSTIASPLMEILAEFHAEVSSGDAYKLKLLSEEATRLLTYTVVEMFKDMSNFQALVTLPERITSALASIRSDKPNAGLNSLCTLMSHTVSAIQTRILELKLLETPSSRPDTLPVILAGPKSIGKTVATRYILKEVAKLLNVSPKAYQMNKPKDSKHSLTYLDEYFGVYDELFYDVTTDPMLAQWNVLFSSTIFTIPGAALPEKKQYIKTVAVVMSTNKMDKNQIQKPSATLDAMFSRAMWIQVNDPTVEAIPDPRFHTFTHRQADFSHLLLKHRPHVGPNGFGRSQELTMSQLVYKIANECAKREKAWLQEILPVLTNPADIKAVEERIVEMTAFALVYQELQVVNPIPPNEPIPFDALTKPKTTNFSAPSSASISLRPTPVADATRVANGGNQPFVIRLQGDPFEGKSRIAGVFAHSASRYLQLPVKRVGDDFLPDDQPGIFLLDDVLEPTEKSMLQYLKWVNRCHQASIIMIVTNYKIFSHTNWSNFVMSKCTSSKIPTTYFDLPTYYPPGLCRRVGVYGEVRQGRETYFSDVTANTLLTLHSGLFEMNGERYTEEALVNAMGEKYKTFICRTSSAYLKTLPNRAWSVEFEAPSMCDLTTAMTSVKSVMAVMNGKHDKVRCKINTPSVDLYGKLQFSSFVITHPKTTREEDDYFSYFANKVISADPTFSMILKTPENTYAADCNGRYKTRDEAAGVEVGSPATHQVIVTIAKQPKVYLRSEIMELFTAPSKSKIPFLTGNAILAVIAPGGIPTPEWMPYFVQAGYHSSVAEMKEELEVEYKADIKWKAVTTLLGFLMTVAAGVAIYQVFKPKKEQRTPNKFDPHPLIDGLMREVNAGRHMSNCGKRLSDEEYDEYTRHLEDIAKDDSAYGQRYNDLSILQRRAYDHYMEQEEMSNYIPNSKSLTDLDVIAIYLDVKHVDHKLAAFFTMFGDTRVGSILRRRHAQPNAVENMPALDTKNTPLRDLLKKVNKAVVRISASNVNCHGMKLMGKLVLTVAHVIPTHGKEPIYVSWDLPNGLVSLKKSSVYYVNRDHDIAILKVDTPEQFPNLLSSVALIDEIEQGSQAFFYQTNPAMLHTGSYQIHMKKSNMWAIPSQNFLITERMACFSLMGRYTPAKYVKDGDCGMPMCIMTQDGPRIAGIHNAYSLDEINFSVIDHVYLEDIIALKMKQGKTPNAKVSVPLEAEIPIPENLPILYAHGQTLVAQPEVYDLTRNLRPDGRMMPGLLCRGFKESLKSHLSPKPHKTKVRHPKFSFEDASDFAPILATQVKDPAKLFFNPLFQRHEIAATQLMKYGMTTGKQPDPAVYKLTKQVLGYLYKEWYGECRILTAGEVVNGIQNPHDPLYEALSGIDLHTSPGVVYTTRFKQSEKIEAFKNISQSSVPYYVPNDTPAGLYLQRCITDNWNLLKHTPVAFAAKGVLKKEILPKKKCHEGSTRLMVPVDTDAIIIRGRLTRALDAKSKLFRHKGASQRGMNVFREMTPLIQRFTSRGLIPSEPTDNERFDKSITLRDALSYAQQRYALLPEAQKCPENYNRFINEQVSTCMTVLVVDGSVFQPNGGNMSGQADTQSINDYVNLMRFAYSLIKYMVFDLGIDINTLSPQMVAKHFDFAVLGDDALPARSPEMQGFSLEKEIEYSADLNISVTPGKGADGVEGRHMWLSRWINNEEHGLLYPALKKPSIERQIQYFSDLDPQQMARTFDFALFEAALWGKEYYAEFSANVLLQMEQLNVVKPGLGTVVRDCITIRPYGSVRQLWTAYMKGTSDLCGVQNYGTLSEVPTDDIGKEIILKEITIPRKANAKFTQAFKIAQQVSEEMAKQNPRIVSGSHANTASIDYSKDLPCRKGEDVFGFQAMRDTIIDVDDCHTLNIPPLYSEVSNLQSPAKALRKGPNKPAAREAAVKAALQRTQSFEHLLDQVQRHPSQPETAVQMLARHLNINVIQHVQKREVDGRWQIVMHVGEVCGLGLHHKQGKAKEEAARDVLEHYFSKLASTLGSPSEISCAQFMETPAVDLQPTPRNFAVAKRKANAMRSPVMGNAMTSSPAGSPSVGNPVSVAPVQAGTAAGISTGAPPVHDDQPASTTMAGAVDQPADLQIRASRDTPAQRPLMSMSGGPPNLSEMNMHQDDLVNYMYRQFHAKSITTPGGAAQGTIAWKLPYGINLLNPYAQAYVRKHKRYNGKIRLTISTSAVPMVKGNFIIGVMRETPPDTVTSVDISTLQKINWVLLNVSGTGEYAIELGDARQTKFFRSVDEDPISGNPTDYLDRPCIICAVYTPVVNQFQDSDATVVFNIRSAAVSPLEDPVYGFYCYEPVNVEDLNGSTPRTVWSQNLGSVLGQTNLFLDGVAQEDTISSSKYPAAMQPANLISNVNGYLDGTEFFNNTVTSDGTNARAYVTHTERRGGVFRDYPVDAAALAARMTLGPYTDACTSYIQDSTAKETQHYFVDQAGNGIPAQLLITTIYNYPDGFAWTHLLRADTTENVPVFQPGFFDGTYPDKLVDLNAASLAPTFTDLPLGYFNVTSGTNPGIVAVKDVKPRIIYQTNKLYDVVKALADTYGWDPASGGNFGVDLVDTRTNQQICKLALMSYSPRQLVTALTMPPGIFHAQLTAETRFLQLQNPALFSGGIAPQLNTQFTPMFAPATRMDELRDALKMLDMEPKKVNAQQAGMLAGGGMMDFMSGGLNLAGNMYMNQQQAKYNQIMQTNNFKFAADMLRTQALYNDQARKKQAEIDYKRQSAIAKQEAANAMSRDFNKQQADARLAGVKGTNLGLAGSMGENTRALATRSVVSPDKINFTDSDLEDKMNAPNPKQDKEPEDWTIPNPPPRATTDSVYDAVYTSSPA